MDIFLNIFILIILIVGLVISAKFVESSFVTIANKLRVNEFFLGFFVLAIITSLPEISIAVVSSNVSPELSLGNLFGATIVILTLIIGISAIKYRGIDFKGKFSEKEVLMGLLTIFLMIVVIFDATLTVFESIVLFSVYAIFIYYLYRKFNKRDSRPTLFLSLDNSNPIKLFTIAIIGAVGIIITSTYIVETAGNIAESLKVSETLIGILMLAIGTNLPELTILLTSKKMEEEELAIGNFFGSACVNVAILGLLGITSRGFQIEGFAGIVSGGVILLISIIFFIIFSWTGRRLSKSEGFLLVAVYVAFVLTELIVVFNKLK